MYLSFTQNHLFSAQLTQQKLSWTRMLTTLLFDILRSKVIESFLVPYLELSLGDNLVMLVTT